MNICVIGDSEDLTSVYISWLAEKRGINVIKLCEETLGVDWIYTFKDTNIEKGCIQKAKENYVFSKINGAFVRFNPQPDLPPDLELTPQERGALIVERRSALQYFLNRVPFLVINRPYSGRSNGSKPYQMHLLSKAGFDVPKWIVSNDEAVVMDFAKTCDDGIIYKSCSGIRSHVRFLDKNVLKRLHDGTSPIIAQQYIKGQDVRVHVVKDCTFPTRVISDGIDYRFEGETNEFQPTSIPNKIENLCCKFAKTENLVLAGFDFRVTDDSKWYCLEVNPVPTFLPYEMATGQPIGESVLDLLQEYHT